MMTAMKPAAGKTAALPVKRPKLICVADVTPKEVQWFWFPYIPRDCVTLIFGAGGIGKSHVTWDLVARASDGTPFPGQKHSRRPMKVLILSAEDDPERILAPGLIAQEARLKNVFLPPGRFVLDDIGCKKLEAMIEDSGASLVIIDPVVAYMGGGVDMWRANEVRSFLDPLNAMANRLEVTIILVAHERKGDEGSDVDHAMGSADFVNAARSALRVFMPEDGCYVMRHAKHNYSKAGPTLTFDNVDGKFVWLGVWEGEEEKAAGPGRPAKGRKKAESFLKQVLSAGPMPAKELEAAARDEKIAPATLNRAKIGVAESYCARSDGKLTWFWRLVGTSDGNSAPAAGKEPEVAGILATMTAGDAHPQAKEDPKDVTAVHSVEGERGTPVRGQPAGQTDRREGTPVEAGSVAKAVPHLAGDRPAGSEAGDTADGSTDAAAKRRQLIHDWLRQEGVM